MMPKPTFLEPDGTLLPPATPHRKSFGAFCRLPSNATLEQVLIALKTATAHITSQSDHLHATLSTGELFIGTLGEITTLLRDRHVAADDVTMPDKNEDDAPTTGERIAIYHALRGTEVQDDIEARRKRQKASEFGIISVRLSGFVLDDWALEQHRKFVDGEIATEEMRENGLARYGKPEPNAE